jgi:hypothetical protein
MCSQGVLPGSSDERRHTNEESRNPWLPSLMDLDPEFGWPCPWMKIMQLLGADHCYLVSGHDGPHLFKGNLAPLAIRGGAGERGGLRPAERPDR